MLRLFYCDQYTIPLPAGHKFPATKYRLLWELLAGEGLFQFEAAPLADLDTIALAHDPEYVRRFLAGALDVVVNNAGYATLASVEDMSEEEFRAQIETNFFGTVNVVRAALPPMRIQVSGY